MAALKDSYHRPKDPAFGDDAKAWVVHVACSKPKDLGYAAEVWSRQALAQNIREHAVEAGLKVRAQIDPNLYPPGLKISDKEVAALHIARDPFHGEWNYKISPALQYQFDPVVL